MQTITKYLLISILCFSIQLVNAQESVTKEESLEMLVKLKKTIEEEEREALKSKVEAINQRFDKGDITQAEAERLKKEAAQKHALNIENRIAIIDNKIELLKRNGYVSRDTSEDEDGFVFRIGSGKDEKDSFIYFGKRRDDKPRRYDRRTSSDMVLAFGLNNAIIEGEKFDDSPYKIGGSRFFEIGWAWKTRVFENSNFLRIKYGYSFQINGLKPKDNMYFTQNGNDTMLEEFTSELKKSKLSITNLVFPVHFEFGPSKRIDREDYFRYSTRNKFKIGIGGYAGFNIGTRQKLKYSIDGENVKDKMKKSFNATSLVYGLSGYIAIDDTALYVKYDMSPIFKDQAVKQNNISFGVRFDMD
ncbi:hypothetical protein [Pontimicrobium sp. SW4]|uniref:PorT family protein n=1 Tax=Pontimicrobium sp. SW4 TaxID=3153519 RepID=A0AAU7BR42_9FLAO